MVLFDWDDKKNSKLKKERYISFEEVVVAIESNKLLDIITGKKKYRGQKIFILEIDDYVYCVPFEEKEDIIILKTIYPSERETKKYLL